MKNLSIKSNFKLYEALEELPSHLVSLMNKAIEARKKAYAPYSKFKVGAAVLLNNGEIVIGSNQENAAYPSGLCAERVAIYQASASFPEQEILAIAISGSGEIPTAHPVSPCGACRQSIAEYEIKQKRPIPIYFMGAEGTIVEAQSIKDLLPLLFDGSLL